VASDANIQMDATSVRAVQHCCALPTAVQGDANFWIVAARVLGDRNSCAKHIVGQGYDFQMVATRFVLETKVIYVWGLNVSR
jgi:hypothetical protein